MFSPPLRKVAITTPNVLARLRRFDRESAKPNNFVISPMLIFGGPTLIAPFCDDPSRWTGTKDGLEYVSVEDGTRFRICKPDEEELLTKANLAEQGASEQVFSHFSPNTSSSSGGQLVAVTFVTALGLTRPLQAMADQ
jgi:hypothetical protein